MTKVELIELAKVKYFEGNKNMKTIYASSDGHFFHEYAKNAAANHVSGKNFEVFTITREEAYGKVKKVEVIEEKEEAAVEVVSSKSSNDNESTNDKPKFKPKKKGNGSK